MLRRLEPGLPALRWLLGNALAGPLTFGLGFAIGLFAGNNLSLVAALAGGTIGGAAFGTAQWSVLRHHFPRAILWIPAQALAWALVALLCSASILFVLLAGMIIGALSGAVLRRLAPAPRVRQPTAPAL